MSQQTTQGPGLLFIGHHVWPDPPSENQVDIPVLLGLERRLDASITAIACGPTSTTKHYKIGGLRVVQLPDSGPSGFVRAALKEAERWAAGDILTRRATIASEPLAGLVAHIERTRRHVPYLIHLQGNVLHPGREFGPIHRRVAIGLLARSDTRSADVVRCLNENIRREAQALRPRGRLFVLGSRVDTTRFAFRIPREGLDHEPRVICVGSLVPRKNQKVLIRGLSMAARQLGTVRLTLVGDGPDEAALRLAASNPDGLQVDFIKHVPNAELPAMLAQHDFFALPSISEGQPRAALEAMSVGLPVLLSDIPAHRELLGPSLPGMLLPADDASCWSNGVTALCRDSAKANRLAINALRVARNHDLESQLDEYAVLVRSLLD